ncbi:Uncharacterised protein at_DN0673 [Pycnogonum litorale]
MNRNARFTMLRFAITSLFLATFTIFLAECQFANERENCLRRMNQIIAECKRPFIASNNQVSREEDRRIATNMQCQAYDTYIDCLEDGRYRLQNQCPTEPLEDDISLVRSQRRATCAAASTAVVSSLLITILSAIVSKL